MFVKSLRAKKLSITLKPFQHIRVTVPKRVTCDQAENFVYQQLDWIQKHQPRIQTLEQKFTVFNEQTSFRTRYHQLHIVRGNTNKLGVRTVNGLIHVKCPHSVDMTSDEVQTVIRQGIERAWRKEAKAYLPGRVDVLAEKHKFAYNTLYIKNTKTRWGSCSAQNNINLSLHVMRLPDYLIDYVILHELVHTIEKNHASQFWNLLKTVCNDAKRLDAELKHYSIMIY